MCTLYCALSMVEAEKWKWIQDEFIISLSLAFPELMFPKQ